MSVPAWVEDTSGCAAEPGERIRARSRAPRAATTAPGTGPQEQALARYAILDTPPDREFDELVELARAATGAAAAALGFHDGDRLWLKARTGLECTELDGGVTPSGDPSPTEPGRAGRPVPLRRLGAPVSDGGRVLGFAASAPIVTSDGFVLGHLLILDEQPRRLGDGEQSVLSALARITLGQLELRRTLLSYHTLVDGVRHVVFQTSPDGRLLSVTPTWSQLTGFGVVRSVGQPLERFVYESDRPDVVGHLERTLFSGGTIAFECRLERLFGGAVPVEIICRPVTDEAGHRRGVVGVIADISERYSRAVEAQHAGKLEALGRLSAGLAHEINTPIQYVGHNTRFLAESYERMLKLLLAYRGLADDPAYLHLPASRREAVSRAERELDFDFLCEEIPPAIQQSLDGVDRVANLISAMKTFTHPGLQTQAPADLNAALRSVVTMAHSQAKFVADFICDLQPLPDVMCSIGDLNQVFLNLLMNAADAIEDNGGERGTITVSTQQSGDDVVVRVADTGPGIPEELRLRIFDAFFTTKEVGRGTGQGLALARSVIERHRGSIAVDSTIGEGTTFTITLPVGGRRDPGNTITEGPDVFTS
ncbi:MAG TPA: ATP-binding protein [Kineosporiaceae bacterium]|nr:ATP-binding protein [Kineosporiaceae bacterium]